jgi:uncharacterized protein YndB with AHSA1/START domain
VISSSRQAFINAAPKEVFDLIADPERQTEWWPDTKVFECEGESFVEGCKVRNVNARPWPMGDLETTLEVAKLDPGKEVVIRCLDTGTYSRAVITDAQGGAFLECEAGNDPKNLSMRVMDATIGKRLFARWVDHAVDRIQEVAETSTAKQ